MAETIREVKWMYARGHILIQKWESHAKGSKHIDHSFSTSGCAGTNADLFNQHDMNSYIAVAAQPSQGDLTTYNVSKTRAQQHNAALLDLVGRATSAHSEASTEYSKMVHGLSIEESILAEATSNYARANEIREMIPNAEETTPKLKELFFTVEKERWAAYARASSLLSLLGTNSLIHQITGNNWFIAATLVIGMFVLLLSDADHTVLERCDGFSYETLLAIRENLYRLVERNWWEWFE